MRIHRVCLAHENIRIRCHDLGMRTRVYNHVTSWYMYVIQVRSEKVLGHDRHSSVLVISARSLGWQRQRDVDSQVGKVAFLVAHCRAKLVLEDHLSM